MSEFGGSHIIWGEMDKQASSKKLHLGIKAARAGQNDVAINYLARVLRQDPTNIPAMLWLAFVLPAPQDSLRVLQRILVLDPNNARARAGLRWVRGRLELMPVESGLSRQPAATEPISTAPRSDCTTSHQKGPAATKPGRSKYRFRYAISAMLAVILVGLVGITIGSGLSIMVPPETLAAWLPVSPQTVEGNDAVVVGPSPAAKPGASPSLPLLENLTSASDTITLAASQRVKPQVVDLAPQPQESLKSGLPDQYPAGETNILLGQTTSPSSTESSVLIGPAVPVDPTPVDPALLAHQPAYPGEKWIEVNVITQEVTAWEGNVPVMSFISSTGLPNTPTVLGKYNIYWKLEKTLMTGLGYYLPNVPYTMYFYQGYALHGTYWHDDFGQPMSRGCVNLSTDNAKTLFEWADPVIPPGVTDVWADADNPGTLVVVHK